MTVAPVPQITVAAVIILAEVQIMVLVLLMAPIRVLVLPVIILDKIVIIKEITNNLLQERELVIKNKVEGYGFSVIPFHLTS